MLKNSNNKLHFMFVSYVGVLRTGNSFCVLFQDLFEGPCASNLFQLFQQLQRDFLKAVLFRCTKMVASHRKAFRPTYICF